MFLPSGPRILPVISDSCVFARVLREEGSRGRRSCVPQATANTASAKRGVRQPAWVSIRHLRRQGRRDCSPVWWVVASPLCHPVHVSSIVCPHVSLRPSGAFGRTAVRVQE